ncbi:MAG: hypothetical protein IJ400_05210 [Clostridia bacterium]|nr:hypothetical protein [Clostridia bacterium]
MKKAIALLLALVLCVGLCFGLSSCEEEKGGTLAEFTVVDSPINDNVWDMYLWENKIFFGTGDGNANTGPITVYAYDLDTKEFFESGVLKEEVINSFFVIDNTLVAPGIDSTENNNISNYNTYENGEWIQHRILTNTEHCFDVVSYEGRLFYGVDADISYSPCFSTDESDKDLIRHYFYKDGKRVTKGIESARVFDLVMLKGKLYAIMSRDASSTLALEVYQYNEENSTFEYVSDLGSQARVASYINFKIIGSKVVVNDRIFIATPQGYYTDNMIDFKSIDFGGEYVLDYCLDDNTLYALCHYPLKSGQYGTSIWALDLAKDSVDFERLVYFESEYCCVSLVKSDSTFYMGTADINYRNDKKGIVLCVEVTEE